MLKHILHIFISPLIFVFFSYNILFSVTNCIACDCLGYSKDAYGIYHIISHNHSTSICVGYAFSGSNSYMGEPEGSRDQIYIDPSVVPNYWNGWGFYSQDTIPANGMIAIWMQGSAVGHAAILNHYDYDNCWWTVDEVRSEGGDVHIDVPIWERQGDEEDYTPPDFYVSQLYKTYGYEVRFESTFSDGKIKILENGSLISHNTPYVKQCSNNQVLTFDVDTRQYDPEEETYMLYEKWVDNSGDDPVDIAFNPTTSVTRNITSQGNEFIAVFKEEINLGFANNFVGISNGGVMQIDGLQKNLPFTLPVRLNTSVNAQAVSGQSFNNIHYSFDHWEDQNAYPSRTFTATENVTHTAYFTGSPSQVTDFMFDCGYNEPVYFTWDQYPNSNVKYRIYRKMRNQYGTFIGPTLLATLNNNQTSYTDQDITKTRTYEYLVSYDARAYFTTEGTEADPS